MKTIIVDDEVFARQRILSLLNKIEGLDVIAECNNGTSAIETINNLQPDLIFLDINIRDMDGFEVLENLTCQKKPVVIFVTAHEDFALKAFEFEAFDYLVKPFKEDRFIKTVKKVLNHSPKVSTPDFKSELKSLMATLRGQEERYLERIAIKQGNKTSLIPTSTIKYILASGVYAEIYTADAKYLHRDTLGNLENLLNPNIFFRVHRSSIVNLQAIKEIVHSDFSEIDVRMDDNKLISVSKSTKKELLEKLGI
ncbi:LytTR family DNA-binding domain-containing protein [Gelidibacter japonicus]|jgi:two-component system LytT family response regulator|uniref:LytR/AlgR family response regulator transcription factor n=1 Tax=Gelidibacter japonicus TaxID=1962232 RepID=UPI002AFE8073|nr:LytTR family DNA-binding domain-containing protein [Gelidibacter japonicus]